ncbi:type VII secretion target [Mycolicibacterium mageritense]|uniref:type VII secretion target n=1 Tax=Mycolicibacterium mageritense TaxID=53462 RepID=UPI0011DC6857|nr:type VII secretion target [Mycolicibacterium mageritense]TXI56292.1 MAG: hypothetical protein E6Q55_29180 [Mycolicibacterium mageritense]
MADSLRVNPEHVKRAASELTETVTQARSTLSVDAQLEAARAAHGPIFARTKEALATVLAARRADLEDQIAFGTQKAEEIAKWGVNFEVGEEDRAQRQGTIQL